MTEGGSPIAGATLRVEYPSVAFAPAPAKAPAPVSTRADGKFVIRLDPGDAVDVRVEAPGFASLGAERLQAGAFVRIVMPRLRRLSVVVRGSDGRPAPDVKVTVGPILGPSAALKSPQMAHAERITDAEGRAVFDTFAATGHARFTGLPGREIDVMVAHSVSGCSAPLPQRATPAGQVVTMRFRAATMICISGNVVDTDRKPVERVNVVAWNVETGGQSGATTDAMGRFGIAIPADDLTPRLLCAIQQSKDGPQETWLDREVAPGASGIEIVLR